MTKEESRSINLDQSDWEIIYSAKNPKLEAYPTTGMWNEGLFPEMAACLHQTIEEQGPTEPKRRFMTYSTGLLDNDSGHLSKIYKWSDSVAKNLSLGHWNCTNLVIKSYTITLIAIDVV